MKTLRESFNSITVEKGETFAIQLNANPSTGYLWDVSVLAGKVSIVLRDFARASGAVGAGGTERWLYKAEETGEIVIEAAYTQPWDKAKPVQVCKFKIEVK